MTRCRATSLLGTSSHLTPPKGRSHRVRKDALGKSEALVLDTKIVSSKAIFAFTSPGSVTSIMK